MRKHRYCVARVNGDPSDTRTSNGALWIVRCTGRVPRCSATTAVQTSNLCTVTPTRAREG